MGTALRKAAPAFAFLLLALWPAPSHSLEEASARTVPSPEAENGVPAVVANLPAPMANLPAPMANVPAAMDNVPAAMDNVPAPVDRVLVIKSQRLLLLLRGGEAVRKFRVALGANPVGPKEQEGDKRTPEGNYVLDWRTTDSKYYKSIHISYPGEGDVARAEARGVSPGGLIMIHGLPEEMEWMGPLHRLFDWTNGCIAVTNAEMDEIWEMVPDGTPIEIR